MLGSQWLHGQLFDRFHQIGFHSKHSIAVRNIKLFEFVVFAHFIKQMSLFIFWKISFDDEAEGRLGNGLFTLSHI